MANQIKCPKCGELFEPGDAYKHELEETIRRESQAQHQQEVEEAKKEAAEATKAEVEKEAKEELEATVEAVRKEADSSARQNRQLKEELEDNQKLLLELKEDKAKTRKQHEQELDEVRKQSSEEARKEAEEKVRKELETQLATSKEEAETRDKQNKELRDQLQDLLKQMRELKDEKDKLSVEYEKKLLEGQDKIKDEAKKEAREELDLKIAEKDKKLQDAEKQILELQRKIQQGSQQLQGEVLELEIEKILKTTFLFDEVAEVKKGQKGADVQQVVRTNSGTECGLILWESKNYQDKWSPTWIPKLKQDMRAVGAMVGILVSHTMQDGEEKDFVNIDGIWVCKPGLVIPVAMALRERIYEVARQKAIGEHRGQKADMLYDYVVGTEFRQQIESVIENYQEMKSQIDSERRTFESQWKRREVQLEKYIQSTASICGRIQGIAGRSSMPAFKGLDMFELESGES